MSDPDFDLDGTYFPVNASGIMERNPLLFQRPVPFAGTTETSAYIQVPPSEKQSGLSTVDILENHVLQMLGDFGEQQFYHKVSADYQAEAKAFAAAFVPRKSSSKIALASHSVVICGILVELFMAIMVYTWRFGRSICRPSRKTTPNIGAHLSGKDTNADPEEEMASLILYSTP